MFWADRLVEKIIATGKYKPYWVDDMKTPSGRIHTGALRGVITHDLIFKILQERGKKATYSWVFNDMDPMDGFPSYLDESFRKHMGEPLFRIPSPEKGYKSFAECYAKQFEEVFNGLGAKPKILWSSEMYQAGKFNEVIREALDKTAEIVGLYKTISGYRKPKDYYPFQPICPKCGKVGTTITTGWDGKEVEFECKKELVKWAEGCGYKGKISPFDGTGKLMWKVDWAAHWKVIGITIEGAGKDHMAATGSHDLSGAICEKVYEYQTPYAFMYEWFLAKGGVKMSSSKGIGISAKEISGTLPPELLRFLFVRVPYQRAIIFDPTDNDTILDLFDEYDKFAAVYYTKGNKNDMGRIWELSQIKKISRENIFRPRFRDVVNYLQMYSVDLKDKFSEIKGSRLSEDEIQELNERIKYTKIWLKAYAPENEKTGQITAISSVTLSEEQKKYLKLVAELLEKELDDPEKLQQVLYQTAKNNKISPKNAFAAIYLSLTGKTSGPKAAWFLLGQDRKIIIKRFNNLANESKLAETKNPVKAIRNVEGYSIAEEVKRMFLGISFAYAKITNLKIRKSDPELEVLKNNFVELKRGLTREEIRAIPSIESYRNMLKKTGIDPTSRKPSPEALLDRIAKGKELYTINTTTDSYNLAVMEGGISMGAFNIDKISTPITLRFSGENEKAFLLGDIEATLTKEGELVYSDSENTLLTLDLNYRDSEISKVDESVTNILMIADGGPGISKTELIEALRKGMNYIQKFCGGEIGEINLVS